MVCVGVGGSVDSISFHPRVGEGLRGGGNRGSGFDKFPYIFKISVLIVVMILYH